MKILFDTNIVLDVMLARHPFSLTSAKLLSYLEMGQIVGFLGATLLQQFNILQKK